MKVKILNLTILILLLTGSCYAQTKEVVDSLKSMIATTKNDTTKINAQIGLCNAYRFGNNDSSMFYGQQALKLARKIDYIPGQILALSFLTGPTQQQGDYPKTLELGFKAIQLAQENHLERSKELMGGSVFTTTVYVLTGAALTNMAKMYITLKDYPKAINYMYQLISLELAGPSDPGLPYGYMYMGESYLLSNQLDSALYYENKAVKNFEKLNYNEPAVYQNLGDIALKSGRNNEALRYYKISEHNAIEGKQLRALTWAYIRISGLFKTMDQPDSALYYAHKGLEVSQNFGQKSSTLAAAKLLSGLYEPLNTKESLHYLKIADAYRDSLFSEANLRAIQTITTREKERQQEIEAAKAAYQNRLRLYLLLTGLAFLLLISLILYRNYKKSKKANQTLKNTLDDLKSTQAQLIQSEKMASLGELTAGIAHEIQNPLNFVNNFSEVNRELIDELQEERDKKDRDIKIEDEILSDIKVNEEKIHHHGKRADAIVKGMLQHSRGSSGQKEPTDLNALADEYLRLSYHGLRARDKSFTADFKLDADSNLPKVNVVPQDIGRVLLNLINNAFYAVSEKAKQNGNGYKPSVMVSTRSIMSPSGVEIRVKDNGSGIPEEDKKKIFQPFFTTKPTGQGTGLGLSMSYDIVKTHGGKLTVESKDGQGTEFTVQLPIV
ncbi:MAG TPA: ATP-binding protein [Balneolales bacterium]|nr:ATP-binding protein [Balneolales bacterium]